MTNLLKLAPAGLFRDHGVRVGCQCFVGVLLCLAIFSAPSVWNTFSLNPTFVTPQLTVIFFNVIMLSRLLSNLPAGKLFLYVTGGAVAGGSLVLACMYITYAANGGSYEGSATKVAVLLALTNPAIFLLTLLRFQQPQRKLAYLFATLVLALSACGVYRSGSGAASLYKFTLWYMAYVALAGLFAMLVSTFVMPTPSGMLARQQLASSLRGIGEVVRASVDLYTAPLNEHGRLQAAMGSQLRRWAIDEGLYDVVWPTHQAAAKAGNGIQAAYTHISAARWEVDLYRPTHVFPARPFSMIAILCRGSLSSAALLLYPVETGSMRLRLCHAYGTELKAAADAYEKCCRSLGTTVRDNSPVSAVLDAFQMLHERMAKLSACVRETASAGGLHAPDSLAFQTVTSVLVTLYSRLRRMLGLLPQALARDQPGSKAAVRLRLLQMPAGHIAPPSQHWGQDAGGSGDTSRQQPRSQHHQPQQRADSWDAFRDSAMARASQALIEGLDRLGSGSLPMAERQALLDRLTKRSIQVAPTEPQGPTLLQRCIGWVESQTGFKEAHAKLGIQMMVAYSVVMCLEIITPVYNTLGQRAVWAMVIVVVLEEATAGSSLHKGILRLMGTIAGGAAGMAIFYFVILCNGLNHANHPQKFVLTTLLLAVLSGTCGVAAAWTPRLTYMYMTIAIIASGLALAGYTLPDVLWRFALWRLALTAIGLVINFLVVTLVFPVTTREVFRGQVVSALGQIAGAAETTLANALPQVKAGDTSEKEGGPEDSSGRLTAQGQRRESQPPIQAAAAAAWHEEPQHENLDSGSGPGENGVAAPLGDQAQAPAGPSEAVPYPLSSSPSEGQTPEIARQLDRERSQAGSSPHSQLSPMRQELSPFALAAVQEEQVLHASSSLDPGVSSLQSHQQWWQQSAHPSPLCMVYQPPKAQSSAGSIEEAQQAQQEEQQRAQQGAEHSLELPPRHMSPQDTLVLIDSACEDQSGAGRTVAAAAEAARRHGCAGLLQCMQQWWWDLHSPLVELVQQDSQRRVTVALGPSYLKILKSGHAASVAVSSMVPLIPALRFEYSPLSRPHRIPTRDAFHTQRTLRQLLNVLSSFASTMDAHGIQHVALLGAFRPQVERCTQQLGACLRAQQAMVQGRLQPQRAAEVVLSFGDHVQHLFLLVMLTRLPGHPASSQGMAFMAMLFTLAALSRMLCLSLAKTFFGDESRQVQAVESALDTTASWSVDDDVLATATGLLGLGLAQSSGEQEGED